MNILKGNGWLLLGKTDSYLRVENSLCNTFYRLIKYIFCSSADLINKYVNISLKKNNYCLLTCNIYMYMNDGV